MRLLPAALSLLAIVALIASTGACQRDEAPDKEPKLAALKKEALATLTLPGGNLVLETQLRDDTALGKPITAQILRVFAYEDPELARDGKETAIDASLASGWRVNFARGDRGAALFGAKRLPMGDATVVIHLYEDEGVHKVSVKLEHDICSKELCGSG